jgi:anti-sigma B factor antagonist
MSIDTIEGAWQAVKATGEVDLSNIDQLRSALDSAIGRSPKGLIIDLRDTVYIDSAGVAVVVSAYRRINKAGGVLALVRPASPAVRRVLDLIGLHMLPGMVVADDMEAAQAQLSARAPNPSI